MAKILKARRIVWIVLGYGIPKDILKDAHYDTYLHAVLNLVWDSAIDGAAVTVLFSGGPSDMRRPYRRIEAKEMLRAFARMVAAQPAIRARKWRLATETRALSTVDNLLNTRRMADPRRAEVHIACEASRIPRTRTLARMIFGGAVRVHPVDFDRSANRYLDQTFFRNKERRVMRIERRAVRDAAYRRRYHAALKERIAFLRRAGQAGHVEAVRKWWETELQKLEV